MQTPTRPILRYHGGKWILAPWIISNFPKHRVYTEVFGGAASVLMQKPRSYAEIYNDKWSEVVNVFRVLRDPESASELRRRIELTPFAREEFEVSGYTDDPIEAARRSIFRSFSGFGSASTNSEHKTGFRANSNRSGTTPAHDWVNWPAEIPAYVERLRGVVIENRDAADVLLAHDSPDTLHYVDPPYLPETRRIHGKKVYAHEMTAKGHTELADVLHSLSGMVVLSGYESEMYNQLFVDWKKVRRTTFADGANPRVEVLWLNPACTAAHAQLSMF
jgi:DNA adenine methylase